MSVVHEIMLVLLDMTFFFGLFEQLLLNSPNSAFSFLLPSVDQTISNGAQDMCRCIFPRVFNKAGGSVWNFGEVNWSREEVPDK